MNDLEDTHCEVRRSVDLQLSPLSPNASLEDDASPPHSPSPSSTQGGFCPDTHYAYLTCRSRLTVFNTRTGASISSWTFRHRISSVSPFPSPPGHIPLLLVGLDNDAPRLRDSQGLICVFDSTISQVLRAIRTPSGVEHLCIITGGASWEYLDDKRVDVLPGSSGLACAALRNLDHLVIDLRRTSWEDLRTYPLYDEANPADLETSDPSTTLRHRNRERHAFHNLMSTRIERYISFKREDFESSLLQDPLTTFLTCSRKIGCIISGCLGHVILWQLDGIVRWISPPLEDNILISHLALLEPTDDPRPFCYLWVAHQDDTLVSPVLRMFAMLFERKYLYRGSNQYFNLEGEPSIKLELDLEEGSRVVSLCPIPRDSTLETESGTKTPEDSLLLIGTEGRTFLFDLNQWYKEQMPRTLGDSTNVDAILSAYCTRTEGQSPENFVVSCSHVPSTLKEFPAAGQGSPEEFFFPNSLSLEWSELGTARITTWMTRGVQSQLLREMSLSGPVIMLHPADTFHRCVAVGLIPFSGDSSFNSDPDSQRDSLLTLCLEQRWTTFLLRCVRDWSDGSAAYLFPSFIRWAVQRASTIKLMAHRLCIPLFDQSGSSIGEAEVRTLRSFCQQMECLSNVVENLPVATQDQDTQQRTLKRITIYLQVLLWFLDVGLLPESQDMDEESLPISIVLRIPYPADRLISIYQEKRERYKKEGVKKSEKEEDLFIDELISRDCSGLVSQWEREATETVSDGRYPPPSLQSLLRSILTDCYHRDTNEMENKHQIIIYLLMDLVMLLQGSCPSVDQLVKYPAAFKLSPSLIKLTQALWLLDHEDYHGFLEIMTGQLVCDSDVKDWHHKLVIRTLIRSAQNKLALIYLRVRKPPLSSLDEQGTVISLSVEHGLVQSAFHRRPPSHYSQLLRRFFKACKDNNRLNDILHLAMDSEEEETFVQFLEGEKCEETRLLYYLQKSRYNEAGGVSLGQRATSSKNSSSSAVFNAYNATLPEITRRFTSQFGRRNVQVEPEGNYPRPLSHIKSRSRIGEMHEAVIRKARETFTRGDRLQIPFITAPSLSLRAGATTSDGNCVMFAERRPYGKRTLDQMRAEDPEGSGGPRKRRRTEEMAEDTRQLSISMVFDTPLVKRKNQMNCRDNGAETPHSILKIRRMIQESISPKESPTEEEREKRPRQIRFSINQPRLEDSSVDEDGGGGEGDHRPEEDEQKIADNSNPEESDGFQSPETSGQNLGQSTILSNDSNLSLPLPGPRRRPSLRKTLDDDLLRKSLRHSVLTRDSSLDSDRLSLDNSVSSDIVSSTLLQPATPRVSNRFDPSVCASTVLSPGSSYEFSPGEIKKNGTTCSINSTESLKDSSGLEEGEIDDIDDEGSIVEEIVTTTSITTTTIVREEFSVERTDLNDNTENESNFEVDEKSYHSMEVEERIVITEPSRNDADTSTDGQAQSEEEKTPGEVQEDQEQLPSDDYDEELLALKYEDDDDNDDVFKSLSNSIEVNRELTPGPDVPEGAKKTVTSRFNEEFNITDDESRSVDESLFTRKKIQDEGASGIVRPESVNITDDESEPEDVGGSGSDGKLNERRTNEDCSGVINKSSTECLKVQDKIQEDVLEEDFAPKSSAESPKTRVDSSEKVQEAVLEEDFVPKSSAESPKTRVDSSEKIQEAVLEEDFVPKSSVESPKTWEKSQEELVEDSTPVRLTRSRRGSSVAAETPEALKTPRTRRATSLVQDVPYPKTSASSSGESPVTPVKRRGRRATSLVKEVLTSSLLASPALGDVQEVPMRRSRRKEPEVKTGSTPGTIEEIPEEAEPVRKGRGRRGASVVQDVTPRMTRGASVGQDDDSPAGEAVVEEGTPRTTSTPETIEEIPEEAEPVKKGRGRRGASVAKDGIPRMTRGASVVQDDESQAGEDAEEAGEEPEPVRKGRGRRGASVVQDVTPRMTRGASVGQDDDSPAGEAVVEEGTPRTTSTPETIEEIPEEAEPVKKGRGRRGASVAKDGIPRMTRGASVAQDDESQAGEDAEEAGEEPEPVKKGRGRRGASVVKEETPRTTSTPETIEEIPEEVEPVKKGRGRRGASVAKDNDAPAGETAEEAGEESEPVKKVRGRRGTSVVKEETPRTTSTPETIEEIPEEVEPVKKGRGRRGASVAKDNDAPAGETAEEAGEESEPVKKVRGRRGTSVVKEETPRTTSTPETIEEIPEEAEPVRKGRGRRGASVAKEGTPRMTRGASSAQEDESPAGETVEEAGEEAEPVKKGRGKRGASVAKDVNVTAKNTPDESSSLREDEKPLGMRVKRTRGGSVAKEAEEPSLPPRRTRAASVTTEEDPKRPKRGRTASSSSELNEEIAEKSRKTRAASYSDVKDHEERVKPKRGRAASTSELNEETVERPRRTRAGSVASEVPEESAKRAMRGASVAKDLDGGKNTRSKRTRTASASSGGEDDVKEEEEVKRTRRGASLVKEEEVGGKRTRGGSVTRDSDDVDTSILPRRARGASVSKDEDEEKVSVRSTRRRGLAPKELPSEPLRTRRGGSIVREVIPEENSDESVNETLGGVERMRGRIQAIPEEEEVGGAGRARARGRRAMSVDLSQEGVGGARGGGRRRAASETKDLEDEEIVERPRRGRRGREEEFRFADPEEARGMQQRCEVSDQVPDFIFSPPVIRSRDNIQDRK
ncbi:protein ELYS isoform X2 [Diachasma alloeum]|uniref:protein ELYS isoform X2 n=1 Tax=Diachasma alloeum TaxID=454923 RepID=UPI000738510E|nr:protein ELYS isoform X2 [Diachasma alloeum]